MKFHLPGDESPATGASLYRERSIHYLREKSRDLAVTTRRLDILAREHQLPSPDLIKLDVQGAELDVLNGAGAALENCSALIIELSLVQGNEGGPLAAEVIAGIDKLGFKCADVCKIRRTVIGSVSGRRYGSRGIRHPRANRRQTHDQRPPTGSASPPLTGSASPNVALSGLGPRVRASAAGRASWRADR